MASIYLALSTKIDISKKQEILIRFVHGRINQRARSNIFILPEHWDEKEQKIVVPNFRLTTDERKELINYLIDQNERLNALTTAILKSFYESDKQAIATDWLKLFIDRINFPMKYASKFVTPETMDVFQFFKKFINEAPDRKDKNTGRPLTKDITQQYRATEKHLIDFAKSIKRTNLEFSDIDQAFYDKFTAFLQKKSFTQNSVGKHIKVIKVVLNEATVQRYNNYTQYNNFHVFTEDIDSIYLNEGELQQLKYTDFSQVPHLDRVRDWFLLLAWTGCRFSDLEKIARTDIKDGFVSFRQQKTNVKVTIPIHPVVLELLGKYDYNLPTQITNKIFNKYVKEVCRIAEINGRETITRTVGGHLVTETFEKWEQVSSHTGRRSFCTNMYKRGLPTLMIMSISGHKTEKSFLKYIKIKQDEHAEMMKKAWEHMYVGSIL